MAALDELDVPAPAGPGVDESRGALTELVHLPGIAATASALDDWLLQLHGIVSPSHGVGLFLDLLAGQGYRVTRIGAADEPADGGPRR